jgi:deoxyribodipyrimidine photolyase-related protein
VKVPACRTLRLILGDQLNSSHSWYAAPDPDVLYVLAELRQEVSYARHHVQKVAAFFLAMREFAGALEKAGHRVLYLDLDQSTSFSNLPSLLRALIAASAAVRFEFKRPDEHRLLLQLETLAEDLDVASECVDSEHFLLPFEDIAGEFERGKARRMEHFYRKMRRRHHMLIDAEGGPEGGRWNYDVENRKRLPERQQLPPVLKLENPAREIYQHIAQHAVDVVGHESGDTIEWPINRQQSLALLSHFTEHALPLFGAYQDAMSERDWLLFHSRLSFSLNTKQLSPAEVIEAALAAARARPGAISMASLEGFIRQILGWREYMRGVYWANMPEYAKLNVLGHDRPLPGYYWTGDTDMACMRHAIGQSLKHAYAHHIQRLMVTGNFALLAGIDPNEVDAWYLGIYIDAVEWVEMPNTRGMSQFADGGIIASKPYCSSGNYINKMGSYCGSCRYRVKERSGEDACPFNSLYWHFMHRHREAFERNPRIGMVYRTWDRMDETVRAAVIATAEDRLASIGQL